jgi:hypothetical protein
MSPEHLARMAAIKAQREPLGMNVHFINESGNRDVFSFNSKEAAVAFRAKQIANGRTMLDGRAGLLVRPDDSESDPYFTRRF